MNRYVLCALCGALNPAPHDSILSCPSCGRQDIMLFCLSQNQRTHLLKTLFWVSVPPEIRDRVLEG